jgi:hypothetical protein
MTGRKAGGSSSRRRPPGFLASADDLARAAKTLILARANLPQGRDSRSSNQPNFALKKQYPYSFHVALDGNGINGLEGMAGVCLFRYDPADNSYAYKISYYDGVAAGHSVNVNPAGTHGFLGNVGQHLIFYDAKNLEEYDRISTLRFEVNDTSLRGSTHSIWLNNDEFITAIGDYFYSRHPAGTCATARWTTRCLAAAARRRRSASGT